MSSASRRWLTNVSDDQLTVAGYALVALVLAGGSGIWLPMVMPNRELGMDSMFSFVMATVAPPTLDLMLRPAKDTWTKWQRMTLIVGASLAMTVALAAFLQNTPPPLYAWIAAWLAVIGACGCWIYASLSMGDSKFSENGDPPAPLPPASEGMNAPIPLPGAGWNANA